jgi:hypothetical protein
MESRIRQTLTAPRLFIPRASLALAAVVGLAACIGTTEPVRLVSITPAAASVALQTTASGRVLNTSVTLTNVSKNPVTFDLCTLTLEKLKGVVFAEAADGPQPPWYTVWSQICVALKATNNSGFETVSLPSGASLTIPVSAQVGQNGASSFDGSPGTYRVHLSLVTDIVGQVRTIPHDLSVSDPFSIVAQ